jgi:hypothetical protein
VLYIPCIHRDGINYAYVTYHPITKELQLVLGCLHLLLTRRLLGLLWMCG